jgi:hypothetical protein
MIIPFGEDPVSIQRMAAGQALESCNPVIARHGLALSAEDIQALVAGRLDALKIAERVEFGGGVAKELVLAFASSPYVSQSTFVETILELQELFYEVKNESLEQISDDDLIAKMRSLFDDVASGDLGYLEQALLEGLARHVREEPLGGTDAAEPGADEAAMNAVTLAHHRYNVSEWVDETYAPAWDGASWLDE